MKLWECVICGYIHEGDEPPVICPVCDASKEFFRPLPDERPWTVTRVREHPEPPGPLMHRTIRKGSKGQ